MKVSAVSTMRPAFRGYDYVKNTYGENCYLFNFPHDAINRDKFIELRKEELQYQLDNKKISPEDFNREIDKLEHDKQTPLQGYYEKCFVEIIKTEPDKHGYPRPYGTTQTLEIKDGGTVVDLDKLGFAANQSFGYRYVIQGYTRDGNGNEKAEGAARYANDPVETYGEYNVVRRNALKPNVNGNGYLLIPDSFAPGYKFKDFHAPADEIGQIVEDKNARKRAEGSRKTFSNEYGGSFAGIMAKIPYFNEMGITHIFGLPIMGGDTASSPKYWNENNDQLAGGLGELNNYEDMMEALFANNKKFVMDAPMTSEGLQGIHYQYAIKWANHKANPFRNYFRMDGIDTNQIGYGIIGAYSEGLGHYLVNAPHIFKEVDGQIKYEVNDEYDPSKPTYIQYYDRKYVSKELLEKKQLIERYDVLVAENPLSTTSHDDTVIKFNFKIEEADYKTYINNIDKLNDINKENGTNIKLDSFDGTIYVSTLTKTKITPKKEAGVLLWDANTDMVKLRYFESAYDYKNSDDMPVYEGGFTPFNCQVMDMNLKSGRQWARKTRQIHNNYVSRQLGNVKNAEEANLKIKELINSGKLPEGADLGLEKLQAIDEDLYALKIPEVSTKEFVTKTVMGLNLGSLELSKDTLGVLTTPWFTDRAAKISQLGQTRYQLAQAGNPQFTKELEEVFGFKAIYEDVNGMFTGEVYDFTLAVLEQVNDALPEGQKLFTDESMNELTEYGYYAVKQLGENIARYAFIKALSPNTPVKTNSKGQIIYDYKFAREHSSLEELGVKGHTPRYEALLLAERLKEGLRAMSSNASDIETVKTAILASLGNTNVNSFKYAEAIVNEAGLDLDWRIDAEKDIEDQDSVREQKDEFDKTLKNLKFFWGLFADIIEEETPSAHIWDEITDFNDLSGNQGNVKERELVIESGHTSVAGYSYFFTNLLKLLTGAPDKENERLDNNKGTNYYNQNGLIGDIDKQKIMGSTMEFLMSNKYPLDYVRSLYTFGGNHDKPRLSYLMAVDLNLLYANLVGLDFDNRHKELALEMITGACNRRELPFDVLYNLPKPTDSDETKGKKTAYINNNYLLGASNYAIANGDVIRSKLYQFLRAVKMPNSDNTYINDEELGRLHRAVTALVNGNFSSEPESRPSYLDYNTAMAEVLEIAIANGLNIQDDVKAKLIADTYSNARDAWNGTSLNIPNYYQETNVPAQIQALGNILRKAAENALADKNMLPQIDNAIKAYMGKFSQEYIEEELMKHQRYLSAKQGKEAECFGVSDIREAIRLVFEKAGMADREDAKFQLFKAIDEPCEEKVLMYQRALISAPGVPTLYAGDEFGMSGHEEKTKNIYHQCRNALYWSKLEGDKETNPETKYYNEKIQKFKEIMSVRKEVVALNNGTPYQLGRTYIKREDHTDSYPTLHAKGGELVPAIMTLDASGNIAVSLFNQGWVSNDNKHVYNNDKANPYVPEQKDNVELDKIKLTPSDAGMLGIGGLTLTAGMILKNIVKGDNTVYKVVKDGVDYVIKRFDGVKEIPIVLNKGTMQHGVFTIFRNAKAGRVHFAGGVTYKSEQYNIVSNPYHYIEEPCAECGKQLSLVSK